MHLLRPRKLPYFNIDRFYARKAKKPIPEKFTLGMLVKLSKKVDLRRFSLQKVKRLFKLLRRKQQILLNRTVKEQNLSTKKYKRAWMPHLELLHRRIDLFYERRKTPRPLYKFRRHFIRFRKSLFTRKARNRYLTALIKVGGFFN